MDFTREPIIETIITPKDGCKLVIRSSKNSGQEEYFVDSVEIVSFGKALFYRSLERPKAFLAPVSDFEVLEVREARMVLKNAGFDRSIKIGGGKESNPKNQKDVEKADSHSSDQTLTVEVATASEAIAEVTPETKGDKKRDRRRNYRKKRGREDKEEGVKDEVKEDSLALEDKCDGQKSECQEEKEEQEAKEGGSTLSPSVLSSLLQPPPTLISETINRYRQNDLFKNAFYLTEEEQYKPHDKVDDLLNEDEREVQLERSGMTAPEESDLKQDELPISRDYEEGEMSVIGDNEDAVRIFSEHDYSEELSKELSENGIEDDQMFELPDHSDMHAEYFNSNEVIFHAQDEGFVKEEKNESEAALPLYAEEEGISIEDMIANSADYYSHFVVDKPEEELKHDVESEKEKDTHTSG